MDTQFAPMKRLGFPSQELLNPGAKFMLKKFRHWQKHLQQHTGLGLNVKTFEYAGPNNKSKKSRGRVSPPSPPPEEQEQQQQQSYRAEKWNVDGMLPYGQYIQEPAYSPTKTPGYPQERLYPSVPRSWPPTSLTLEEQTRLLDLYYEHVHTCIPLLDKITMQQQLNFCRAIFDNANPSNSNNNGGGGASNSNNNDSSMCCFLSPLFFYALFALASRYASKDDRLHTMGNEFMQQAVAYRDEYSGYPCISSVLALLLMVEYLQQIRQRPHVSYAWLLAGEAFRMVTDLGIHKLCNVAPDSADQELAVRAFWAAFTTDRLMSLTYGRPFTFEEKDIGVQLPKLSFVEKTSYPETEQYLRNFTFLIDVSKVVGRIIRFNYSAHSGQHRIASLHQEAMLSTLDSWVASLIKDAKRGYEQITNLAQQQFERMKQLVLHTLLVLLHQPYVDNAVPNSSTSKRNGESKPSFDICAQAAIIVTQLAFELSSQDLQYMVNRSAIILYTLLTATRVHLMNASYTADRQWATHGEFSFLQSIVVMNKLQSSGQQQQQQQQNLLTATMDILNRQFEARPDPILSDYANAQVQMMQQATVMVPDNASSSSLSSPAFSVQQQSKSLQQILFDPSLPPTPSSCSTSSSTVFMITNNNDFNVAFNEPQPGETQGDTIPMRTPPLMASSRPSLKSGGNGNGNKVNKFIAVTPGSSSSSSAATTAAAAGSGGGGGKQSVGRSHNKEAKHRNKKRCQTSSRKQQQQKELQPPTQQQQQQQQQQDFQFATALSPSNSVFTTASTIDTPSFGGGSNNGEQQQFSYIPHSIPTSITPAEQPQTTFVQQQQQPQYQQPIIPEHEIMQQNPQFQFQAQQQFQHFQDSQHQQPTAATTTPSAPVVSSSSASGEQQQSYNQYDLQQFLQNTQFLAQASQAMDTTTATPIYFNPTIEMILDEPAVTTGTLGDGTMDAATTVVNTTMTTQANYQNILPTTTMMMPMFGSSAAVSNAALAAPGGDDLQNYFVPYPTTTITYN